MFLRKNNNFNYNSLNCMMKDILDALKKKFMKSDDIFVPTVIKVLLSCL